MNTTTNVEVDNLGELGDYINNTPGMAIPPHDYIEITTQDANHNPTTVVYKDGGASGTIVATITIVWDEYNNVVSVLLTK